jgi:hypothetical protein
VGGAIAAGGYGYGGYGYNSGAYYDPYSTSYSTGYSGAYYNPYSTGQGYSTSLASPGYTGNPGYAQFENPQTSAPIGGGGSGGFIPSAGNSYPDPLVNSFGKCWINDNKANYQWGDCPKPKHH